MSKQELIREEMVKSMKSHDKERKDSLSMLLSSLKNAEIAKMDKLTEDEENAVIQKEIKQVNETLSLCPRDREDIQNQCEHRIAVFSEFCPKMMDEQEIENEIQTVICEIIGLEKPTVKDKGKIMRELMPRVKGKADGKIVNQMLMNILNKGE